MSERDLLLQFLEQQPFLTKEEALQFCLLWHTRRKLRRSEYLNAAGQTERYLWFVANGALRLFFPTAAEEICVGFAYSGGIVTSAPSFIRQAPSSFSVQALRPCILLGISRTQLQDAMAGTPNVARLYAFWLEQSVAGIIEREIEISTTTPEERYQRLLQRSPHIFQWAPLKHIASYLRIRPETLSRVRRLHMR
jgi:CRP-like cAMP-binding protein